MKKPGISLRLRLTLAFATGMAVVLAALGAFLYVRLGAELLRGIDFDLRSRAGVILTAMQRNGPVPVTAGRKLIDPDEAYAQVLLSSGRIVDTSPAVAGAAMLPSHTLASIAKPTFLSRHVHGVDDPSRLLAVPVQISAGPAVVVVGAPLGDRQEALNRLLLLLAIGGPIALALSSAAGWLIAGAALRPVERMRREAATISESDVQGRLAVPGTGDELTRLATTLNALLGRLQEAIQREHRFVDDASHELRTPLAVLKAELDLALARPRTIEELEAAVRRASTHTDGLVRLAEDLLVLARIKRGRLPVRRVEVSLRGTLEDAAAPFRDRARSSGSAVRVVAPDESVSIDPVRIRQAVQNLLDNALRYAGSSEVVVTGDRENGAVRIQVEDGGSGFPDGLLAGAFEPFVTGPPASEESGAGLGLSIVQAVAEAHGGRATAENVDGRGARVVLILPA